MNLFFFIGILIVLMLGYFKIAEHFGIVDTPNQRSSHSELTIRGGGVIFPLAMLIYLLFLQKELDFFLYGLLVISCISFIDDIRPLPNKIRIIAHLISVSLLFLQVEIYGLTAFYILIAYILVIGSLNAYNFMDGINGLTVGYSLVAVTSFWIVNEFYIPFIDVAWLRAIILALILFGFFNFRKKAKCFAGDVGSFSISYILAYLTLLIILETNDLKYIGFFLLYGLDTISTIIFRLMRRENIFLAHRTHFYQFLANNARWPHLKISVLYLIVQAIINVIIIRLELDLTQLLLAFTLAGFVFLVIRYIVEGQEVLLGNRASSSHT